MVPRESQRHYAFEQLIGADPDFHVQQDRVKIETVRTGTGSKILLAMVADGDGHELAGESAQLVIDLVFESVRQSVDKDLSVVLNRGLEAGNQAMKRLGGKVSVIVLAIHGNRYYLANVGQLKAFLIRQGKVISLAKGNASYLGASVSPQLMSYSSESNRLLPGDQIVLASDGLTRINPEDGKPFVDPKDLPNYVEGNSPREAARHILSIAMGRDVDDNVSVVVIQTPGKKQVSQKLWIYVAVIAVFLSLAALIIFLLTIDGEDETVKPVDYGYAVVLSGSGFVETGDGEGKPVEKLGTVPPLAVLEAQEPTRLSLQSSNESSTDVSLISIYLSSRSKIKIQSIDSYLDMDGEGTRFQNFPTSLTFLDGSLLVLRNGGVRRTQVQVEEIVVSLTGSGRAILGVRSIEGEIHVGCLQGGCAYEAETGEITSFQAGQMLKISQTSGGLIAIFPLPTDTAEFWNDLCGGCLSTQ